MQIFTVELKTPHNGIHTVGYYTDEDMALAAVDEHNRLNPGHPAFMYDYPANELLSNSWGFVG